MKKFLFILILLPFVSISQVEVFQGPNWHPIRAVDIEYAESPTKVSILEENQRNMSIRRISQEEISQDTLAINVFFLDCYAYFIGPKFNDTVLNVIPTINTPFNLIVRTYLDTSNLVSNCYDRDFYTLMDSVFIPVGENSYSTLSVVESNKEGKEITVYPNPAKEKLFIKQGVSFKLSNFEIINSQGNLMIKGKVDEFIDVSSLDQGIYFIHFGKDEDAEVKRFVVN